MSNLSGYKLTREQVDKFIRDIVDDIPEDAKLTTLIVDWDSEDFLVTYRHKSFDSAPTGTPPRFRKIDY